MPFDGLVLAAVRHELEAALVGSRVQRVNQPDKLTLLVQLRAPGHTHHLLLSAHPHQARVHLTTERMENPLSPPLFCSVCRKHLEGGRVEAITQPGLERVFQMAVTGRDELGQVSRKLLVAEIMGRHSNVLLIDEATDTIVDAIKRYSHAVSRFREVLPGRAYLAPSREKADPAGLTVDSLGALLLELPVHLQVWEALQRRFEGLSPLTAREVVYRAGLDAELTLEFCGAREMVLLGTVMEELFTKARQGQFEPTVILGDDGTPVDFAALGIEHRPARSEAGTMNNMLDRVFRVRAGIERVKNLRGAFLNAIGQARKRLDKRLDICHSAAAEGARADEMKVLGEVLTANLFRLRDNTDRVVLENFYTGAPVEIALDPRWTPAQNAQNYFKRYHKLRKKADHAHSELAELETEALYLEALETAIELSETPADLNEIREELTTAGYLKDKGRSKRPQKETEPQPLEHKTTDGTTVFIGRNNRQNELVTFRIGRSDDLWLHTKHIPGAHVVIRTGGRPVSDRTLAEAAAWAAWFSKSRHGTKVPVDYTQRKHVQKPKGSRPGFVIYTHEQTILVDPQSPSREV